MSHESDRSHLFVVRVWIKRPADALLEYRGRIQHVLSGETRHFKDWPTMVDFLETEMAQWESDETDNDAA